MVLLGILSEVPRIQHFLTKDGCADQAHTHKKTIFIEAGIRFSVIKQSFVLNISFPSSNHYLKKRIISIYEK